MSQMVAVQDFLKADPENADFLKIQAELEEGLAAATEALEPLLANLAALEAKLPKAPEPVVPKFDREKHPVLKKAVEKTEVAKAVVLKPGDICEALWRHDKLWYKAKILSMLGSASDPKYHVRFLDYDETVTVDRDAVRPLQSKRKHEAEPTLAPTPASHNTPVTSTPHVISGPVSVNPNAQVVKQNPPSEVMEPKKRHKIPNKKALEKGVNSWKDWNSKGVGKKLSQKESMFRSGTTVNSRGEESYPTSH
jgi:survival-of-motor-neuron-related-splicing factor 30